ncbi:MAG: peptide chain release factor 2 [Actinomycetia bacterium]|nr:peptide chain release factor 2 [Actinomycetes bacterium]
MVFEIDKKKSQLDRLQKQSLKSDFWENKDRAQKILQDINSIKDLIDRYEQAGQLAEDTELGLQLLEAGPDAKLESELKENLSQLKKATDGIEEQAILSGPYDAYPAVLNIHPGAGGTESQDWAEMLLRMYTRWMEKRKLNYRMVDLSPGDEAGIKNATLTVKGDYAYGLLKGEKGIHRLVRISPFDSSKRRHTSFASVEVTPLFEQEVDININKEDLKIDTFRSSGAGGQHVNVTDSAVRITHQPSGIVVSCQDERSQMLNRQTAMQILKSKLYELEMQKKQEKMDRVRGEKKDIAWGNQIRSYTLQPYQLIKDHRTGVEIGDVQSVLDGDIDEFIRGYLEKMLTRG